MHVEECECCKKLTSKLYNVSRYSDLYTMVCSACFIEIIKRIPNDLERTRGA